MVGQVDRRHGRHGRRKVSHGAGATPCRDTEFLAPAWAVAPGFWRSQDALFAELGERDRTIDGC
jgi:hypothetical protein